MPIGGQTSGRLHGAVCLTFCWRKQRDAKIVRGNKPYALVNCKTDQGIDTVVQHIIEDVLFDQPPKKMVTSLK